VAISAEDYGRGILISTTTHTGVGKDVALKKVPAVTIQGKNESVDIFEVL